MAAPAANRAPVDSPAAESAVSTRREPGDSWTSCLDRQNTADRAEIPGKDGGCPQKVHAMSSGRQPAPHAEQSTLCPSAHGRGIRQTGRILAVRCCLLGGLAGGDPLTGLLSAMQAVVPGRRQPIGQDREGLSRTADRFRVAPKCIRRRSSWAGRSRRPWPMIVWFPQTGHRRGSRSSGITPGRCCLSPLAVR